MTGKLLIAPNYENIEGKLIFLAGPIQGAPNWQAQAISIIQNLAPEMNIASPRRKTYDDSNFIYAEQVDWERHHLNYARQNGAIMFWLAKEHEHRCDREYAQTTRFELGESLGKGAKVAVGIEEGFTGAKYVRHVLPKEYPEVPICESLEETCKKALELLLKD
jgi:hypothetical protein